jgi:hypothetical protein
MCISLPRGALAGARANRAYVRSLMPRQHPYVGAPPAELNASANQSATSGRVT